jgi:hypothetical protein
MTPDPIERCLHPVCSALSPWHHYVTLHIRRDGWTQSWLSVLIYAKTIFAAKIIAQREHPGYTAIKVDGSAVIPSPNDALSETYEINPQKEL